MTCWCNVPLFPKHCSLVNIFSKIFPTDLLTLTVFIFLSLVTLQEITIYPTMPTAKLSGDIIKGLKGISIRDSEGHEFRMDLTQTQAGDTCDGACILDEPLDPDGLTDDEEEASQSSRSRRCVRKVSASRASQVNSSQDDFVDTAPPKKINAAGKHTMPGLRTRSKVTNEQASAPIQDEVCPVIFCSPFFVQYFTNLCPVLLYPFF